MTLVELGADLGKTYATFAEQYQGVIEKVGTLADEFLFILVFGCDDHFYGFLAGFFGDFIHALFKEIGGIRALDGVLLSVLYDALELAEHFHADFFAIAL